MLSTPPPAAPRLWMDAGSRVLHLDDLPALDDINKLLASDDSPVLAGFLLRVMRQLQLDDAGLLDVADAGQGVDAFNQRWTGNCFAHPPYKVGIFNLRWAASSPA